MDPTSWRFRLATAGLGLLLSAQGQAIAASPASGNSDDEAVIAAHEADRPGRIDYGYGIGVRPPAQSAATALVAAPAAVPPGAEAHVTGFFGSPAGYGAFPWPIVAIHVALLPDGRVFNFGSTEDGKQGGYIYDVWDPAAGTGPGSHLIMPNNVPGVGVNDIFCAGQSLIGGSRLLIAGGDLTINGQRYHSIADAETFDWTSHTLATAGSMQFPRWYPAIVPIPSGERVVLGGRQDFIPGSNTEGLQAIGAPLPEVYTEGVGWRTLYTAGNDDAYGKNNWFYPRGFQAANGQILIIANNSGKMFYLDPAGTGKVNAVAPVARPGKAPLPTLMYAAGKILSVRLNQKVDLIDVNGPQPVVTPGPNTDQVRFWSSTTLMADGRVLLNGGSGRMNQDVGTAYKAQIWNPATGQWSDGAMAQKMRLYHSNALLLPDATVLTIAGGDPGPVRNMNAEIYYPSYLFNADGTPAARPTIVAAPQAVYLGQPFQVTAGAGDQINRATLLRIGAATHSLNLDQRFFELALSGAGTPQLWVVPPSNINFALPGYYMLFVFNAAGTPSLAKIMWLS